MPRPHRLEAESVAEAEAAAAAEAEEAEEQEAEEDAEEEAMLHSFRYFPPTFLVLTVRILLCYN
jgi:hypothetical protein